MVTLGRKQVLPVPKQWQPLWPPGQRKPKAPRQQEGTQNQQEQGLQFRALSWHFAETGPRLDLAQMLENRDR